ncbi:MAG: Shedu immune nuclease family protein [Flavobacteriales bacterium]
MIEIIKRNTDLLLKYNAEINPTWLDDKLKFSYSFNIKRTFRLNNTHFIERIDHEEFPDYYFKIGQLEGEYYKLNQYIFQTKNWFFFHKEIDLYDYHFIVPSNISILKKIDTFANEDIYIGGERENIMPMSELSKIISLFPNSYELNLYRDARVTSILRDYFDTIPDKETKYTEYVNNKSRSSYSKIRKSFQESEIIKYNTIIDKLKDMLRNETSYTEKQWQNEIIQIILLIFPKYIAAFQEVQFRDIYSSKSRRLDYGLIDFMGNLDLIEIKIPFAKPIVSQTTYRDNHIPNRDLSGAIMQIEKYIYHLNKLGKKGEIELTKKYQNELPEGLQIRITNPHGMIIMGRDTDLNANQIGDFEIIKRKYKNVIDIFTYDELIRRLDIVIQQLKKL